MVYTDCTQFCTEFRKCYREHCGSNRRRQFHKIFTLKSTHVECKLYTGLSVLLYFKTTEPTCNGPYSTSKNKMVSERFAKNKGMVLETKKGMVIIILINFFPIRPTAYIIQLWACYINTTFYNYFFKFTP